MPRQRLAIGGAVLLLALAPSLAMGQRIKLGKIDLATAFPKLQIYALDGGEAAVAGSLIKRVEGGRASAVITYFNKTNARIRPNYQFRLINAYGFEVGEFSDSWLLDSIGPGAAHKVEKTFPVNRIDRLLQFTKIELPQDWESPVYLVIEGSQP